jgi:hypothetical protein
VPLEVLQRILLERPANELLEAASAHPLLERPANELLEAASAHPLLGHVTVKVVVDFADTVTAVVA